MDRVHTATSRWPSLISSNDHPAHTRPAIPQCQTRPGGLLPKPEQNHARTFNWPKTMTCIWPPAGTSNWPLTGRTWTGKCQSGLGSRRVTPDSRQPGLATWNTCGAGCEMPGRNSIASRGAPHAGMTCHHFEVFTRSKMIDSIAAVPVVVRVWVHGHVGHAEGHFLQSNSAY